MNLSTTFAHTCANRSAPLTASPAMCRPSGSVFPRTLTGQPKIRPVHGQRQQTPRARALTDGAFLLADFL